MITNDRDPGNLELPKRELAELLPSPNTAVPLQTTSFNPIHHHRRTWVSTSLPLPTLPNGVLARPHSTLPIGHRALPRVESVSILTTSRLPVRFHPNTVSTILRAAAHHRNPAIRPSSSPDTVIPERPPPSSSTDNSGIHADHPHARLAQQQSWRKYIG